MWKDYEKVAKWSAKGTSCRGQLIPVWYIVMLKDSTFEFICVEITFNLPTVIMEQLFDSLTPISVLQLM